MNIKDKCNTLTGEIEFLCYDWRIRARSKTPRTMSIQSVLRQEIES
jgi:hypothetical protein